MSEDKINQTVKLQDGRYSGFAEYGKDGSQKTVFYFNGSGGSRLENPTDKQILTDLDIRFIATDRPGHGLSSPQPDRKLLDWPIDIWQGEVDKNVPLCQGKYQHEKIPNNTFTIMPGQAHLYLLANWRIVLERLVAE